MLIIQLNCGHLQSCHKHRILDENTLCSRICGTADRRAWQTSQKKHYHQSVGLIEEH